MLVTALHKLTFYRITRMSQQHWQPICHSADCLWQSASDSGAQWRSQE